MITCLHTGTDGQKGDLLTKEMAKPEFERKKTLSGLGAVSLCASFAKGFVFAQGSFAMTTAEAGDTVEYLQELLKPGADSYVVDTGSGHHLINSSDLNSEERESIRESLTTLKLSTAKGSLASSDVCDVYVKALGCTVEARALKGTPRVLSVCLLVEDGAVFYWSLKEGAVLVYKGTTHKLIVEHGVPLLPVFPF